MKTFDYAEPRSIGEAVDLLGRPGRSRALAGGTDLLVRLRRGAWEVDRVVNLKRIEDLRGVRGEAAWTRIGALTTLAELADSAEIARRHPILLEAALQMSSPQVRNLATVGGNLCNASPAADLAPPLLCLEAELRIAGPAGERTLPIREFFVGPGRTALKPDELLTEIRVPARAGRSAFLKFSPRSAMDLAVVNVACFAADGDVRVAVGAAGPTPRRVPPSPEEAMAACAPIDDLRASAEYRRALVRILVRRALEAVR